MSVTDQRPGPQAPAHTPWCTEHVTDDGDQICQSPTLRLRFAEREDPRRTPAAAELYLARPDETGRTLLNVLEMTLDPDQIRPLAMALLAYDALANSGDPDAHAYYRGQAEDGATR